MMGTLKTTTMHLMFSIWQTMERLFSGGPVGDFLALHLLATLVLQ